MTTARMDEIIEDQLIYCKQLLIKKGEEYADMCPDRLQAFKTAAAMQNISPIQALGGMMAKHTTSIYDLINRGCGDKVLWDEKITDHINYLLLLKCLIFEASDVEV